MMPGRRYGEGQHPMASVTFQNYFRMYDKLAGMTGTAMTEAEEFGNIYSLNVIEVPTNLPVARIDDDDEVYRTVDEKFLAITMLINECRERNQPVLVGTTSIEKSEKLAELLENQGLKDFKVLNARHHEQEAQIIAAAGVPGAVTIATNMAGRGTDIQLGGNFEMRAADEIPEDATPAKRKKAEAKIKEEIAKAKEEAKAAGGLFVPQRRRSDHAPYDQ